jgi:hypothetical protein
VAMSAGHEFPYMQRPGALISVDNLFFSSSSMIELFISIGSKILFDAFFNISITRLIFIFIFFYFLLFLAVKLL